MIQVFDDIVDIFDQEIIKNNLFKEKDWEFIEDVSAKDNILADFLSAIF